LLLIADLDDSLASRGVLGAFSQGELGKMFEVQSVDIEVGRARIHDGDGSALLVVPLGFGEALLRDQPCRLELVKNPARTILPRIAEETLGLACDAVFYAQRIAGDRLRTQLETIWNGPPSGQKVMSAAFVAGFSIEINNSVERLVRFLDPLAIEVKSEPAAPAEEDSPRRDFVALFLPTMLFLALFFVAQGLSEDLWREKSQGTLRRANQTPHGLKPHLLGKLIAALCVIGLVGAFAIALAALKIEVSWLHLPLALAWLVLSGGFLFAVMCLTQAFAQSQRGGNLITNSILFPLSMLGGAFFPFEVMPKWMAAVGRLTPNGWALERFKDLLFGEIGMAQLALNTLGLTAVTLLILWLARRRIEGAFLRA
jgi:ABC-2 type transport system permease protein